MGSQIAQMLVAKYFYTDLNDVSIIENLGNDILQAKPSGGS